LFLRLATPRSPRGKVAAAAATRKRTTKEKTMSKKPTLIAYNVREREGQKPVWTRIDLTRPYCAISLISCYFFHRALPSLHTNDMDNLTKGLLNCDETHLQPMLALPKPDEHVVAFSKWSCACATDFTPLHSVGLRILKMRTIARKRQAPSADMRGHA
jgi:hypothetical protein